MGSTNVIGAAATLVERGHDVTLHFGERSVAAKGEDVGAQVIRVDWADWISVAENVRNGPRYDLVFAQPFQSRKFALYVNQVMKTKVVAMFHGFRHDFRLYVAALG